jgi:hypothetical protein
MKTISSATQCAYHDTLPKKLLSHYLCYSFTTPHIFFSMQEKSFPYSTNRHSEKIISPKPSTLKALKKKATNRGCWWGKLIRIKPSFPLKNKLSLLEYPRILP